MTSRPPTRFKSNPNKDYLRTVYDRQLIEAFAKRRGSALRYLGLPGPDMLDIIEWQDFLEIFTTIERGDSERHEMILRAHVKDVEHRLHSLHGEFDKILIEGVDRFGRSPKWPYPLVNLDFYGGFLYQNLSRPKALRKLIENQHAFRSDFLLIVTHDLREADVAGEKRTFFETLRKRLGSYVGDRDDVQALIDWYVSPATPDAARQAIYATTFFLDEGEAARFAVKCLAPITYIGTGGTKMIHHVAEFTYQSHGHRAVSEQSLLDLLNLGYRELRAGEFVDPAGIPRITASRRAT